MDVMDEESITRICTTAFSEEEIVNAKDLLFSCIPAKQCKKLRKRQGKTLRNVGDIVCLLKETDPEEIPIFVARDLQKLPPVHFDHVDVTRLLKDIVRMRNDIDRIGEEYATVVELQKLRTELEALKNASIVNNFPLSRSVNNKRGACLWSSFECDSGPMGLATGCEVNNSAIKSALQEHRIVSAQEGDKTQKSPQISPSANLPPSKKCSAERSMSVTPPPAGPPPPPSALSHAVPARTATEATVPIASVRYTARQVCSQQCATDQKSYLDVAQNGVWKPRIQDEEWTLVQKKRLRNRFVGKSGKAIVDADSRFRAADSSVPIFIYNISKEASACDIKSYIKSSTNLDLQLEKINMKIAKEYDAYKVYVPKSKLEVLLNDNFWPDGILYRRFVEFRAPLRRSYRENGDRKSSNGP
ncbi:uncharacterized protein LOC113240203 [Hyposmocoma kahamanoa]|uniref:uncharacterized protein LOC113240203 n=1 Tax=Hyposmocoma kahamanoa TaxID=1477025 RepID=UPI000E6D7823|nr:uncharacterized protein LOC113240203 [Hyposmocoma kahamanoa]